MVAYTTIFAIGLATFAQAAPTTNTAPPSYDQSKPNRCKKIDAFLTGLPPNHPLVIEQGYSPTAVNNALRADQKNILAAGYNLRGELNMTNPKSRLLTLVSQSSFQVQKEARASSQNV